jgi:hypothetical protein
MEEVETAPLPMKTGKMAILLGPVKRLVTAV